MRKRLVGFALAASSLWGCHAEPVAPKSSPPLDIVAGRTSRQDLLLSLGDAIGSYEQDHVLVWGVATDAQGRPVGRASEAPSNLPRETEVVVVFGADGMVEKFSTVHVIR